MYLEECSYEIKKKRINRFIDAEFELDDFDSFDFEWVCFSFSRGMFYARELQTRVSDKCGLTLEQHSWYIKEISRSSIY